MTWVRTEDAMPLHPKLLRLSDGAYRLWSNGLHFANRAVTDGRIEKALVASLNHHGRWTSKQMTTFTDELVPGLWIDCGDHFEIHDYAHHQAEAMKERVERKREHERDKKKRQRDAREGVPANVPRGQTGGRTGEGPREISVPTRPDPTRPGESANALSVRVAEAPPKSPAATRAERLRLGYLERFAVALPGIVPHGQATQPMGGGPWLDLARETTDADAPRLLDAFFADDWCRKGGAKLGALVSERVRLLTQGPTSASAPPAATMPAPVLSPARQELADASAALEAARGTDSECDAVERLRAARKGVARAEASA